MLQLETLAWKANQMGISYGKLGTLLTPQQIESYIEEYLEYRRKMQIQEQLRL
jgi:hypothetical protein